MAPALGGIGTGGVAAARGSIGTAGVTPARGSTATTRGTIATTGMAPATATATAMATATAIIRDGDLAGRQMSANQCDRGSGQRRTNHRGNHEPLQSLWRASHDQSPFHASGYRGRCQCESGANVAPRQRPDVTGAPRRPLLTKAGLQ
jgi:hypothetical protein